MNTRRIEQLSKLAALHASGALDDGEFDREKTKILKGPSRWSLYLGGAALAAGGATLVAFWTMRDVPVALPQRAAAKPSASPLPIASPPPIAIARSPAQDLRDAFLAATGHRGAFTTTTNGEDMTVTPLRIIALPFGRALLTRTETRDGCHACVGFIGVHYLSERDGRIAVRRSFPEAVSGWAWGNAPDFELTTRFTSNPAIYSTGGDMHQGYAESGALLTELTPAGPASSDLIDTGSDNTGAITDESTEKACSLEGKIANIVRDRSFEVRMSGTASFKRRYAKRGGRIVALDKDGPGCA